MQEYVVGFLHNNSAVVLIEKNRPEWQAGLLNGVGGHIESHDASPHDAMVREFKEETGVYVSPWEHFLTLEGTQARVFCYAATGARGTNAINKVQTETDEVIHRVYFRDLHNRDVVPNLRWIIPIMRQRDKYSPVTVEFHESTKGN